MINGNVGEQIAGDSTNGDSVNQNIGDIIACVRVNGEGLISAMVNRNSA